MSTLQKKKTAKKPEAAESPLLENPQINQSEYDCVSQSYNTSKDAIVLTLSMFVGSAESISFTPEGEDASVDYTEVGGISLDDTFELLDGTKVKFRVIKGKSGKSDRLVVRPVNSKTRKGKPKPQF